MSISVVIPTHNRKFELKRAIESVSKQTTLPDELLVIDDGSEPAIEKSLFDNCRKDLNFRLLRNETAKGANKARNLGIREAKGSWIAFLDDDDQFLPTKIEEVNRAIAEYGKDADLFYHPAIIRMVKENVSYRTHPNAFKKCDNIFKSLLVKNQIGGTPMVIVRKQKLFKAGLFNEELKSLQDYELWIRLAKYGANMRYIPSPLTECNYLTKKNSISKSLSVNKRSLNYIEKRYSDQYSKLTESDLKKHEIWKWDMQIHKAYLNKQYWKPIMLNFKAGLRFKKVKYFLQGVVSFLGTKFIFKLRSIKG